MIALSRSTNPKPIVSHRRVLDVTLSPAEMAAIHKLARDGSHIVNPPGLAPHWDPTPDAAIAAAL